MVFLRNVINARPVEFFWFHGYGHSASKNEYKIGKRDSLTTPYVTLLVKKNE